jgi:hypothetical protein
MHRRLPAQALMPAFTIVKLEIVSDPQSSLCNGIIGLEVVE